MTRIPRSGGTFGKSTSTVVAPRGISPKFVTTVTRRPGSVRCSRQAAGSRHRHAGPSPLRPSQPQRGHSPGVVAGQLGQQAGNRTGPSGQRLEGPDDRRQSAAGQHRAHLDGEPLPTGQGEVRRTRRRPGRLDRPGQVGLGDRRGDLTDRGDRDAGEDRHRGDGHVDDPGGLRQRRVGDLQQPGHVEGEVLLGQRDRGAQAASAAVTADQRPVDPTRRRVHQQYVGRLVEAEAADRPPRVRRVRRRARSAR